jgi:hypothetical protein
LASNSLRVGFGPWSRGGSSPQRPYRPALGLVLLAFLVGPVGTAIGEWVDEGGAPAATFSLLLFVVGVVLARVGKGVERLVFGNEQRPWLSGRLKRWQRLILPFGTDTVITRGISAVMAGGTVLLTSNPGWSALNVVALGFVALGSALIGFALSRLLVGLLVIRHSGLWRASRRAWIGGGTVIALATLGNATHSIIFVLGISAAI